MTTPRIIPPWEAQALREGAASCWTLPWRLEYTGAYEVHEADTYTPVALDMLEEVADILIAAPDLAHTAIVLGEQREAVLALHRDDELDRRCKHDRKRWPCPTARALGVAS